MMAEQKTQDNDLIFALDIGTRSVVGVVGRNEGDRFKVLDIEMAEHRKRAMIDGQIDNIRQVAELAHRAGAVMVVDGAQSTPHMPVDVKALAPETVTVELILSVKPREGLLPGPVIDRVKAALRAWFDGSLLGQDVLLAQIGQKIFAVDGVANYQIQGPVNDVTVGRGQLPVLGKLSVEELR